MTPAKKILSLLLTAALLFTLLSGTAMAAVGDQFTVDGIKYQVIGPGAQLKAAVIANGYSGAVTIPATVTDPGSGLTYNVTTIGNSAFESCATLTSVNMPSVVYIWSGGFRFCTALTSVNMPSVTYVGSYAFDGCSQLPSINMPLVTEISFAGFRECRSLTSLELPYVTSIGDWGFQNCNALQSMNMPSVTSIGYVTFQGCTSLSSVQMPLATSIGTQGFQGCTSLTSLYIPKVTSIGNQSFQGCTNLATVYFESSLSSVGTSVFPGTTVLYRTQDATGFDSLNLSGITKNVYTLTGAVSITGTFRYGETLHAVPSGISTTPIPINQGMLFYQWTRDGSNIIGSLIDSYTLTAEDTGKVVNVTVWTIKCAGGVNSDNATPTAKLDPSYTIPVGLITGFGKTLGNVTLPTGFSWDDPLATSVGTLGTHTFTVTYTPADTAIYNTVSGIPVDLIVQANPTANNDAFTVAEDSASTVLSVLSNDTTAPDIGETLTVTAVTQPASGTVTLTTGVVRFTPTANFNGTTSFTYTVSDGRGGTATATVTVTVTPVNDPPNAMSDAITITEDSAATALDVLSNDTTAPDTGETLTVTAVTQPASGTVTLTAGVVRFTPAANFNGITTFTYTISDSSGGTATATVTVTVTPVNDPPNAINDAFTVAEDSGATAFAVLSNDMTAPDLGETLTVTAVTQPASGTVTFTASVVQFTPAANFNGITTFTYTISDGNGGTATATVTVTVTPINDPPNAINDAFTVAEDSGATAFDVLSNDMTAPDVGETLTVTAVTQPSSGTVTLTSGVVQFTPAANFNGITTFTYTVSDGNGGTATATVPVTVTPVNDLPNAINDAFTVAEDSGATAFDVLSNDMPAPDTGETLTVTAVTQPVSGTVTFTASVVQFTPAANFNGITTFTYTISDGNGGTATATVTITVSSVNDPPNAINDAFTVAEDSGIAAFDVLANDTTASDAGETLTVTAVTQPASGTVTLSAGVVRFTPAANFNGLTTFTYTVSDGNGGTATATVPVTVTPVNDPPGANDDEFTVNEDSGTAAFDVLANDTTAPDTSETLTVTAVTQPASGTVTFTASVVRFTPAANFNGITTFTYTISDGNGATDTGTVTVTVTSVNDSPPTLKSGVPTSITTYVIVNNIFSLDLSTLFEDADGDSITYKAAINGAVPSPADMDYSYTPTVSGTTSLVFTANDGTADSADIYMVILIAFVPTIAPTYNAYAVTNDSASIPFPVTVNEDNGSAVVEMNTLSSLIVSGTVITVPSIPDVNSLTFNIPASYLSTPDREGTLTLQTDIGSISVPSDMLTGSGDAGVMNAALTIGRGNTSDLSEEARAAIGDRPLIQLTLKVGEKQTAWNNPGAPVIVRVPYMPTQEELKNPDSIVIWYIDGSGAPVSVPNGRYDPKTGTVIFSTTHFSDFAVGYNHVSFGDVAPGVWYEKAVSFIAARGIASGTGNGSYSPISAVTRGEFIVMLMRAYNVSPDLNARDNFADAGNAYYSDYLAAAKRLGIAAGFGNNKFAPQRAITRQEMFTLLYNTLKLLGSLPNGETLSGGTSGKKLSDFKDSDQVDSWATSAVTFLVETGVIDGSDAKLSPASTATRAEMTQMFYNLLSE